MLLLVPLLLLPLPLLLIAIHSVCVCVCVCVMCAVCTAILLMLNVLVWLRVCVFVSRIRVITTGSVHFTLLQFNSLYFIFFLLLFDFCHLLMFVVRYSLLLLCNLLLHRTHTHLLAKMLVRFCCSVITVPVCFYFCALFFIAARC